MCPQPARSSTSQSCQQIFGSLRVMTLVIIATRKKFVQLQKFVSLAVKPGKTLTPSFRLLRVAKIPKNRDFWNPPFLNRSKTKTRKGVFLTFLAIFWLFDSFGGGGTPPPPPLKSSQKVTFLAVRGGRGGTPPYIAIKGYTFALKVGKKAGRL